MQINKKDWTEVFSQLKMLFEGNDYGGNIKSLDIIIQIIHDELLEYHPERYKEEKFYRKIRKEIYLAPILQPFQEIIHGDSLSRRNILCKCILSSIDQIEFLKVKDFDYQRAKQDCIQMMEKTAGLNNLQFFLTDLRILNVSDLRI